MLEELTTTGTVIGTLTLPQSTTTVNGTSFYVSGQGVKGDTTQGVFLAQDGAITPTAIDTSTDTRTVGIYNGQLYVTRDSTQGTDGSSSIATYGATLPTAATTSTVLPGINGHITLAAGQANGVNTSAVGTSVNRARRTSSSRTRPRFKSPMAAIPSRAGWALAGLVVELHGDGRAQGRAARAGLSFR